MRPVASTFAQLTFLVAIGCASSRQGVGSGSQGGTGGTSDNGGTTAGGVSGSVGVAGQSGGGETADCSSPQSQNPPGTLETSLEALGGGACANQTLGAVLVNLRIERPELADIVGLYGESSTDGSFVYAYQTAGGFAFAFKRGWGDCEAGCISNEYFYFVTDESCQPQQIGQFRAEFSSDSNCYLVTGTPLWNRPKPFDPIYSCTSTNEPSNVSGTYRLSGTGQVSPCALSGKDSPATPWTGVIGMRVVQDLELATGTVTLTGTGHPLLDNRALPASFERRRLVVDHTISNLPSSCPQQATVQVTFDVEGYVPASLRLNELDTPDCAKPDEFCKGFLDLGLCATSSVPMTVTRGGACTYGQDQTCNDDPTLSALAGACGSGSACACNPGYGLNLNTGKCAVWTAGADAVCASGMNQTCNGDLLVSWLQGLCLSDGSCWCIENSKRDPATGKCVQG